MKLLITLSLMWFSISNLQAQSISHIETTKNWYYIYDQNGKMTLKELINSVDSEEYSDSPLFQKLRGTKL